MTYETDYLVIGAGTAGLAFTDALRAASDADVILLDRRERPGGHWRDAYPFVRLHQPSATYGVNSRRLGSDTLDASGGYERATGAEICAYFDRVLEEDMLPSGRVRFLGGAEYLGGDEHVFVRGNQTFTVKVRRKVVDARYLETSVPATHTPSFAIGAGVRVVPVGALPEVGEPVDRYVVLGAGKTAIDACLHLLDQGTDPDRIRWIRPRDQWLYDRATLQPLAGVGSVVEGFSLDLEAVARAGSVAELFARLEASGRLLRLDRSVTPTMFRCAIVDRAELARLRTISDVVRLGRVERITAHGTLLQHGRLDTGPRDVFVDATAAGLAEPPVRPIFSPGRITLQQVRPCAPSLNAAVIGHVEATRADEREQNRLCPPIAHPTRPVSWLHNLAGSLAAPWGRDPELGAWLERSRLNVMRGVAAHADEPRVRLALERRRRHLAQAIEHLPALIAEAEAPAVYTRRATNTAVARRWPRSAVMRTT